MAHVRSLGRPLPRGLIYRDRNEWLDLQYDEPRHGDAGGSKGPENCL